MKINTSQLIELTFAECEKKVNEYNFTTGEDYFVVKVYEDHVDFVVTADINMNRIRIGIKNGKIMEAMIG